LSYKDTLNLPKTSFPMKGNLASQEPKQLEFWENNTIYHQLREQAVEAIANNGKVFVLADGPPYANGDIHIGHAVNKILKDFVIRSKRLSGYAAPYVPGWDCHGLPIELQVEKKHGKSGVKLSRNDFIIKCREYAEQQIQRQKQDFMRLGVLGDWQNPYKTMDFATEAATIRALGEILKNGHIHRGTKPVYWSVASGSALAEAEVEYQDKDSFSIDVRYPIVKPADALTRFGLTDPAISDAVINDPMFVAIWTTTPWTLPSSQAVSVNAEVDYELIRIPLAGDNEHSTQVLMCATALRESLLKRWSIDPDHVEILGDVKGQALEGLAIAHPFYDKTLPVILGDHVSTEAGTGLVHTAPDHGLEDFLVGKQYDLEILNLVDDRGVFRDKVEFFGGQHVHKVNEGIIEKLESVGNLLGKSVIHHSYPHCWRTKTPLIYRATAQWFISMTKRDLLLKAKQEVADVMWVPEMGEARIQSMLDSSPDWCISRQRNWGTPLPFFTHKETGELHPRQQELIEQVAQRVAEQGITAWHDLAAEELLGDEAKDYIKATDSLDVWFDSGSLHYTLAQRPDTRFPADVYLEGADQHRGWFQTSLKSSVAINETAPYKAVITHGFVVDGDGNKMSKSLGNVVSPSQVIQKSGADILRLWSASTDYTAEMRVSDQILDRTVDSYRRIRNTLRFMLANLHDFEPSEHLVSGVEMLPLDSWLVQRATEIQKEILEAYDEFHFVQVVQKIHHFCNLDLGGFYLDIVKDRQYTCKTDSLARRSAQTAIYHTLEALVRLISPVLCFTAEEVWQHMPGKRCVSVNMAQWYKGFDYKMPEQYTHAFWLQLIAVRNAVNKEIEKNRKEGHIRGSLDAKVIITCSDDLHEWLGMLGDELRFVLQVSAVEIIDHKASREVHSDAEGMVIKVAVSQNEKCDRCWHRCSDIGVNSDHPAICGRCVSNIEGSGEQRVFG